MSTNDREFLSPANERLLKWLAVGLISLIAFEALAVATAMPTVVKALEGENLYALALGVVMATQLMTTALAGPWSDHRSPTSCLFTGLVGFVLGLALCTFAPNMYVFVLGRAIQGLGGGLCVVPLYTLIGNNVHPLRQPSFFAAFAAAWVLPALIGPAIAGFIVQHFSWRIVFGVVPVILLAALPLFIHVMGKVPQRASTSTPHHLKTTITCAFGAGIFVGLLQIMSGVESADFGPRVYAFIAGSALLTFIFMKPLLPIGHLHLSPRIGLHGAVPWARQRLLPRRRGVSAAHAAGDPRMGSFRSRHGPHRRVGHLGARIDDTEPNH